MVRERRSTIRAAAHGGTDKNPRNAPAQPDPYAAEAAVQWEAIIMAANCDAVAELLERAPKRPQDGQGNGFDMLEKHDALCK